MTTPLVVPEWLQDVLLGYVSVVITKLLMLSSRLGSRRVCRYSLRSAKMLLPLRLFADTVGAGGNQT